MINNRNKSVVKGMSWNSDGQKICIVYEDGAVIVGSVDGNRIWGKELKNTSLSGVCWSPDSKLLLFSTQSGEVHSYDSMGTFVVRLKYSVLDFSHLSYCSVFYYFQNKLSVQCLQNISQPSKLTALLWFKGRSLNSESTHLVIAFDNGRMQMMRDDLDESKYALIEEICFCHGAKFIPCTPPVPC